MNYNFGITLKKGVMSYVVFFLGFWVMSLIGDYPDVANLTIGAGLTMVLNWLKVKYGVNI